MQDGLTGLCVLGGGGTAGRMESLYNTNLTVVVAIITSTYCVQVSYEKHQVVLTISNTHGNE